MQWWGELEAKRQRLGMPLNTADGMIAATALEHGLTIVTCNVKDFRELGVEIVDLFESRNPALQWPQAEEQEPELESDHPRERDEDLDF